MIHQQVKGSGSMIEIPIQQPHFAFSAVNNPQLPMRAPPKNAG